MTNSDISDLSKKFLWILFAASGLIVLSAALLQRSVSPRQLDLVSIPFVAYSFIGLVATVLNDRFSNAKTAEISLRVSAAGFFVTFLGMWIALTPSPFNFFINITLTAIVLFFWALFLFFDIVSARKK